MTARTLDRAEIDAHLRELGVGVLSLADGGETYAVPESFGYDGDALYFQFGYDDDSDKMSHVGTTDIATFTAYTVDPAWSVVVRGRLEFVPESDATTATEALASNATIPNVNVSPDAADGEIRFTFYRLVPDDISGRAFGVAARSHDPV